MSIDSLLGIAPGVSSRASEVQAYYTQFLADDGQAIASGWLTYAAAHTNLDAATAVQAYADQLAAQSIGKSVQVAATGTGTAVTQIAQGTTNGLEQAASNPVSKAIGAVESAATAIPDLVSRLTSGALWVRIAEVALGLILIAVGVAELTHAVPIATKVAKRVGAGAALAA